MIDVKWRFAATNPQLVEIIMKLQLELEFQETMLDTEAMSDSSRGSITNPNIFMSEMGQGVKVSSLVTAKIHYLSLWLGLIYYAC